ncbi:hypothetical protein OG689_39825 [Kitasatospora sp. NBC_00240]|uniref:hypothetical protein n=1 Tax=Kitasatospora sp. NBC_00240 TaxID=2903567 RepID=UPI002256E2C9|nr:hypothetical protein [Kitasatospora sp. NBC_00240]MCX5215328.1 hypothetical protein [Kitasatospora sp. NBC_00240]
MYRLRAAVPAGAALLALATACSSPGGNSPSDSATATSTASAAASAGQGGADSSLPPRYTLTAPQAVGSAQQIKRNPGEGLADRMGVQLAALFPERTDSPVAAAFDINRVFYFAGISGSLPHPGNLGEQADLALRAVPAASSSSVAPTLSAAATYPSDDPRAVLRCAALTLHNTDRPLDVPVCAWADAWSVGVLLDYSSPPAEPGAAELTGAAQRTSLVREAARQPGL